MNAGSAEPIDSTAKTGEKLRTKFRRKLAPADLSDKTRARIVALVDVHEDYDRVTEIALREFPGIRWTPSFVMGVYVLGVRRPASSAGMPMLSIRRGQAA